MKSMKAFTLIELLIVVAIIGILAAIAIPNFLQARTKANVARAQADLNGINTALSAYQVDNNAMPPRSAGTGAISIISAIHLGYMPHLTTPVSYMASGFISPFGETHGYWYHNWDYFRAKTGQLPVIWWNSPDNAEETAWMISTFGPDATSFPYEEVQQGNVLLMYFDYNPSNGIVSPGIIQRHGN